jgi:hypothetical protein
MKFWTSEYTFDHPWEKVAQAAWRKYPNPMNPSVTAIDVLNRKIEKGVLHSERLISSIWGMPSWVQSVMGSPNVMYANEKSEVDPDQKTMILKTRNITFCKYIAVDETLVYQRHPDEPEKTLLKQEAVVLVQGVPLSSYMESMLTTTISSNASKGRMAMEWVIKRINDEIKELQTTAVKNTDEFLNQTKKSIDGITVTAKKSMDDFSSVAKKSIDELQYKLPAAPPSPPTIPKL